MARKKDFKRCPRCDTKCAIHQPKCPACGLVYARLAYASNKEAKRLIRKRQRSKVVFDKTLPKDVNKWKLFCMALFLGFAGGHNFYTGRYRWASFNLIATVMIMVAAALPFSWWNDFYLSAIIWVLITPAGLNVVLWIWDIFKILFNSYKVPVAIGEASMLSDNSNIDNKEVMKIVELLDKKVESEKGTATQQDDTVNKAETPVDAKPQEEQKVEKEVEQKEEEPFVPQSKVISSSEVKKLVNKSKQSSQNKKSNNSQKSKKK